MVCFQGDRSVATIGAILHIEVKTKLCLIFKIAKSLEITVLVFGRMSS